MSSEQRDAAGLHDPHGAAANGGTNGNTGAAQAATADNGLDHTARDATSATAAMGVKFKEMLLDSHPTYTP